MWYDIDKYAEGVMRSAERSIKAAEQSTYEPPWDGFCGLVRVCDDEELKERGVIRAVVRTAPAAAATVAAATQGSAAAGDDESGGGDDNSKGGGGAAAALSDWLRQPRPSTTPEQQQEPQQHQQQHGVLTPWQQQDAAPQYPTHIDNGTQATQMQPHDAEQQQQHQHQHQHHQHMQQHTSAPSAADGVNGAKRSSRGLLSIGSFSGSEGYEGGGDLGIHLLGAAAGGASAGAVAGAGGGVPNWVAACLLDADTGSAAAAAAADSGAGVSGPAGQQEHDQQQQKQQQQYDEASYQQQQEDLDRLLQEVFAAAEQEVQAEDSRAPAPPPAPPPAVAAAAVAEPGPEDAVASKTQVSPAQAAAAAAAAEQSLQAAPDAAAAAEFARHADLVVNLIDLDDGGSSADRDDLLPVDLPGGVAVGAGERITDDVDALLAAADEAAFLEAKFGAPGMRTRDLSSLDDLPAASARGSMEQLQEGGSPAAGAAAAAVGSSQQEQAAPVSTSAAAPAAAEDLAGDPVQNASRQDEVDALLAAAADAVALESKHGPGFAPSTAAADVAARVSALGVTSAAGWESEGSNEHEEIESGEGRGSGAGGKGSDREDASGSSDGSSSSGSSSDDDSDEDEWLDDLPVAPSHAAVQQQPRHGGPSSGRAKGRKGRKKGPGAGH